MTTTQQRALEVLRDIDTSFHRLFEAIDQAGEIGETPASDPLATLQRAQTQIDAALIGHHSRTGETTRPETRGCVLQWDPPEGPPRRLGFEPKDDGSWRRRKLEWTGAGWRGRSTDAVEDVAVTTPAHPRYPNPVDPPTIETLIEWIDGGWTRPDPPVLVFEPTATTHEGVVAAVDGELRYRHCDSSRWVVTTADELSHHLEYQGQPTLKSLSETSLEPRDFTMDPLPR